MTHDRAETSSFSLTRKFLAMMLGVHRSSVSIAASISAESADDITITDRKARAKRPRASATAWSSSNTELRSRSDRKKCAPAIQGASGRMSSGQRHQLRLGRRVLTFEDAIPICQTHRHEAFGGSKRGAHHLGTAGLYFSPRLTTCNLKLYGRARGGMGKRIYIYRSGTSDKCALTAIKDGTRLPPAPVPGSWRFWMQIGPAQAKGGRCGFDVPAAVHGIRTKGYYLFKGSRALLQERRPSARAEQGRSSNA